MLNRGYGIEIKRAVEDTIVKRSNSFPFLLLTWPRQVGKATLLQYLSARARTYITLDDPDIRILAKNDRALFMQRYTSPLLIDEIQYAPEILPYIKKSVDRSHNKGDFWLSGSQMFEMMKNVSESLAGRVRIVNLLWLSNSEINSIPSEIFTISSERLVAKLIVPNDESKDSQIFVANILNGNSRSNVSFNADIVFADVPYGNLASWSDDNLTATNTLLDTIVSVIKSDSIIVISSDKKQKINNARFVRIQKLQVGKRKIEFLKMCDHHYCQSTIH